MWRGATTLPMRGHPGIPSGHLAPELHPAEPAWSTYPRGDSFTNIFQAEGADLPRRLHHLLGAPVDVLASNDGGSAGTHKAFARRQHALDGKRLVIWTFATRSVMKGDWQILKLKRP
jgi:hypothetical protein